VVAGRGFYEQAAKRDKGPTINGKGLPIAVARESAKVGGANIVSADIQASNGVIHVVDAVLLP